MVWILLIASAATFFGHGLYAMGYYGIPLDFRMMTTEILELTEEQSFLFLKVAGWLDFVVVILLFIPVTRKAALIYMVCWGGATAVARMLTYYDTNLPWNGMGPWLVEVFVRAPHWLAPLWLLMCFWKWKPEWEDLTPIDR